MSSWTIAWDVGRDLGHDEAEWTKEENDGFGTAIVT